MLTPSTVQRLNLEESPEERAFFDRDRCGELSVDGWEEPIEDAIAYEAAQDLSGEDAAMWQAVVMKKTKDGEVRLRSPREESKAERAWFEANKNAERRQPRAIAAPSDEEEALFEFDLNKSADEIETRALREGADEKTAKRLAREFKADKIAEAPEYKRLMKEGAEAARQRPSSTVDPEQVEAKRLAEENAAIEKHIVGRQEQMAKQLAQVTVQKRVTDYAATKQRCADFDDAYRHLVTQTNKVLAEQYPDATVRAQVAGMLLQTLVSECEQRGESPTAHLYDLAQKSGYAKPEAKAA